MKQHRNAFNLLNFLMIFKNCSIFEIISVTWSQVHAEHFNVEHKNTILLFYKTEDNRNPKI